MFRKAYRQIRSLAQNAQEFRRRRVLLFGPEPAPRERPLAHRLEVPGAAVQEFGRIEFPISVVYPNLRFIHVGKSGGSSIRWALLSAGIQVDEYHTRKPVWRPEYWYFMWIRNPLTRFVSAFNFSKEIVAFDLSCCDRNRLTMNNCPAPHYIQSRFDHGYAFDAVYDELLTRFPSAAELAESLTSSNRAVREAAFALMRHPQGHIFKGLGWYLDNGAFVRNFSKQLLFVGRLEYFGEDLQRLSAKAELPVADTVVPIHKRKGGTELPRELSSRAVENLRKFYGPSDYAAVQALVEHQHIPRELLDRYRDA